MAQRRMFSLQVVDTDQFLEMPPSAQLLYFHLGMRADDDGFVASPKRIAKCLHCRGKDLQLLTDLGLLIAFDSGVVAITDWKRNNAIRADRYGGTIYLREKCMLRVTEDKRYALRQPDDNQMGDSLDTQVRLG